MMRLSLGAQVSLIALFSSVIFAIPPPAAYPQQPLSSPSYPKVPRWRSLSNRFIGKIWGVRGDELSSEIRKSTIGQVRQHSAPTLARYGGDVVVRFNISSTDEARSLAEAVDVLLLDVWEFAAEWVDIRLAKDLVPSLLGLLPMSLQTSHMALLRERELVQAVADSYPAMQRPLGRPENPHAPVPTRRPFNPELSEPGVLPPTTGAETNIFFNDYQPLTVIEPWLRLLASLFTTHVRAVNIGVSYQGRDIPALRVGVHSTNDDEPKSPRRKTILVMGGLHAREWISTTTVNYIAYSLITGYGKVPFITQLLMNFDFVFVPTINPDGYVYTWETDRLWRKSRQQTSVRFCQGQDLDRSFGFEWDGSRTAGNPCSESFAGEEPFEALEAKRLAEWAKNETENNNVEFVGFLDLHSYSQQILYPYSFSCDQEPPGLENLEELAMGLAKAIRLNQGHDYEVAAACEGNVAIDKHGKRTVRPRMEESGGSALDWFYHELGVRFAYQIKLRDRGSYGFLLPRENIVPTGKEILDAILYYGRYLSSNYGLLSQEDQEAFSDEHVPTQPSRDELVATIDAMIEDFPDGEDELLDVQWELRRLRRR